MCVSGAAVPLTSPGAEEGGEEEDDDGADEGSGMSFEGVRAGRR